MKENKNYISAKTRNLGLSNDLNLGKLPPQALDLEESVLGALMLEKDALTDVIDILKPENFYKDANKEIYYAIIDLFNNSEPVDLLTVTTQLKKNGKLDFVGGAYYVTQLTTRVNSGGYEKNFPESIDLLAPSHICEGVLKSGSPKLKLITSTPLALYSLARAAIANVDDSSTP